MTTVTRWLSFRPSWLWFTLGAAAVAGLYGTAVWQAPHLLDQRLLNDENLSAADRLSAEHNARLMAISLGGAFVIGIGLLYTARNYRLARRGQVTDRFTEALVRLGSTEAYVRIGGIYAIEHVMRESANHHGDVVEVLINFVRERVPHVHTSKVPDQPAIYPRPSLPVEPDTDVQIALDALAGRPARPDRERAHLHLHRLHLRGAWLSEARLQGADLNGADLQNAHLDGAQLQGADLTGADLRGADLTGANLQGARLAGARLH
jgi:hypothetical protein